MITFEECIVYTVSFLEWFVFKMIFSIPPVFCADRSESRQVDTVQEVHEGCLPDSN